MTDSSTTRPSCKVARVIDEHDLDNLGTELEDYWTADGSERLSLRNLADFLNKRILEQVIGDSDLNSFEVDVDSMYENLTSDDVSTGVRTETRNQLEQHGVDVGDLLSDFVTYQAIRTYLNEWREVEYETITDSEKIEKDLQSIQRLITRTQSVTEDRIEKLRDTNRIDIDEFGVLINAEILCQNCGKQYSLQSFFEERGCDCL
jgi:hypothetical protein